jgi:NADPH2:quinone reductase
MAAMTAAVGIYRTLGLPLPKPSGSSASTGGTSTKAKPLIIYGASSPVGAFAVKLAHLSGVHPIIAIAGAGSAYVRTLLDEKLGDVVLDYRRGDEELLRGVSSALNTNGLVAALAFDSVPDVRSQRLLGKLLMSSESISGQEIKHTASVFPLSKVDDFPGDKVERTFVMSPIIFQSNEIESADKEANRAFSKKVTEFFGTAVKIGTLRGHPYEIVAGGLRGIQLGLENLQRGKNSAVKYVYETGKQQCTR